MSIIIKTLIMTLVVADQYYDDHKVFPAGNVFLLSSGGSLTNWKELICPTTWCPFSPRGWARMMMMMIMLWLTFLHSQRFCFDIVLVLNGWVFYLLMWLNVSCLNLAGEQSWQKLHLFNHWAFHWAFQPFWAAVTFFVLAICCSNLSLHSTQTSPRFLSGRSTWNTSTCRTTFSTTSASRFSYE